MGKFIDLTGMRFGRLVVLKRSPDAGKGVKWICRCDCGNTTAVYAAKLKNGHTTVAQTAHEIDLKVGPDIKIPPEVTFKDVKNETVLGDPNNMHITTGHFNLADLKKRSETHE